MKGKGIGSRSSGWVYVALNDMIEGHVKIGASTRTIERMKDLRYGSPITYRIWYRHRVEHGLFAIERLTHNILAEYAVSHEWFKCSADKATRAIREAADRYARGERPKRSQSASSRYRGKSCKDPVSCQNPKTKRGRPYAVRYGPQPWQY